jgi:hypothetical protein
MYVFSCLHLTCIGGETCRGDAWHVLHVSRGGHPAVKCNVPVLRLLQASGLKWILSCFSPYLPSWASGDISRCRAQVLRQGRKNGPRTNVLIRNLASTLPLSHRPDPLATDEGFRSFAVPGATRAMTPRGNQANIQPASKRSHGLARDGRPGSEQFGRNKNPSSKRLCVCCVWRVASVFERFTLHRVPTNRANHMRA